MRNKTLIPIIVTLAIALLTASAFASEIKDRMVERRPAVLSLLADGTVGENNQGFLEFRGTKNNKDVVSAENKDRATIYKFIAKKHNTTPALVGQRRAAKIAEQAAPGTWLQDQTGKWYKK